MITLEPLNIDPFHTCDGVPASNERLTVWMIGAIVREDYDRAAEITRELSRRGETRSREEILEAFEAGHHTGGE